MNPALRVPLEFATGCLILSRYPRRPGLGRRVTLLGLACGSRYLGETSQARLLDTAQDAYNLPLDVPEKQFWRRIMGAVICDDKRTVAWRHVVRRTASRWAEEPTEYYALAVQSMRRLEWNSITMLPVGKSAYWIHSLNAPPKSDAHYQVHGIHRTICVRLCWPVTNSLAYSGLSAG